MKTTPLRSSLIPMKPNYVDPLSPIASSPRNSFKLPTSNMKEQYAVLPAELTPEIPESGSWTSSLFSPVLKLFASENEEMLLATTEVKMSEDDTLESKSRSEDEDEDDDDMDEDSNFCEFDPFIFMAQLPPHHTVKHNVQDSRPLPYSIPNRPTLILDLDETLVHCSADPSVKHDVTFSVQFNGSSCQVYVKKRPHLDTFLEAVAAKFEIVVFTASQRVYAERLLDILDPHHRLIHHRLYRESCLMVAGNLLKDLSSLNRDLKKTMIVDNSPHAFGYQLDNGIPIESWYEDPNDVELLKLLPLLEHLLQVEDVRPHIRNVFGLHNLVNEARGRIY